MRPEDSFIPKLPRGLKDLCCIFCVELAVLFQNALEFRGIPAGKEQVHAHLPMGPEEGQTIELCRAFMVHIRITRTLQSVLYSPTPTKSLSSVGTDPLALLTRSPNWTRRQYPELVEEPLNALHSLHCSVDGEKCIKPPKSLVVTRREG